MTRKTDAILLFENSTHPSIHPSEIHNLSTKKKNIAKYV